MPVRPSLYQSSSLNRLASKPARSIGVYEGLKGICEIAGLKESEIDTVFHGTTVATNA